MTEIQQGRYGAKASGERLRQSEVTRKSERVIWHRCKGVVLSPPEPANLALHKGLRLFPRCRGRQRHCPAAATALHRYGNDVAPLRQ